MTLRAWQTYSPFSIGLLKLIARLLHVSTSSSSDASPPELRWFDARALPWRDAVRELWQRRELWWQLALRDLQVRYRQTWAGVLWAILQPLTYLAIFTFLFGLRGQPPADKSAPYYLFVWCGLLPWQFFQSVVTASTQSLVNNRALITKAAFPRELLPFSTMLSPAVDFTVAGSLLLFALGWEGRLSPQLLAAPLFLALVAALAAACGLALSAMNAVYRDTGHAVPLALMLGLFASPVAYQVTVQVPARWQAAWWLNPLAAALEGVRWACLGTPFPPAWAVGTSVLMTVLAGGAAWRFFHRIETRLVDTI